MALEANSMVLLNLILLIEKKYASISGYHSTELDITCSVPQGSTLRSLSFLIYKILLNLQNQTHFC